ncbi:IS5 family transposase, partial (plasmid) [Enterobacter roggenkampii]|uniref:IS5 family transposase n=1 Tax=Enterobacter roggenkampii TaxID=1812935 RepID=UPI0032AF4A92
MSHQLTFADSEFSTKRRQTRKEIFLSRMEQILPWQNMTAVIEPFYPKAGNGRRPYPLETMLRIHCMQHWYNLSDGAMEDALYEIASMRLFARLSLDSALPDRTTIMNFRHLLEQHQLARQLFKTINRWLAEAGVMMTQGTLVDATIIEAPSSTKNKTAINIEYMKASIRAKVEHPFRIIKRQFGFVKARYKGLLKN